MPDWVYFVWNLINFLFALWKVFWESRGVIWRIMGSCQSGLNREVAIYTQPTSSWCSWKIFWCPWKFFASFLVLLKDWLKRLQQHNNHQCRSRHVFCSWFLKICSMLAFLATGCRAIRKCGLWPWVSSHAVLHQRHSVPTLLLFSSFTRKACNIIIKTRVFHYSPEAARSPSGVIVALWEDLQ